MSLYSGVPKYQHGSTAFLRTIQLFNSLTEDQLNVFCARISYRNYAAGVTLFHQDMPGTMMYLLEEGTVRVYAVGLTGQEATLNTFGPGGVFGEMAVLGEHPERSASAITMSPSKIWSVSKTELDSLLARYPQVAREMIHMLVRRVRTTARHYEAIIFQDVLGRLAFELVNLSDRLGEDSKEGILISMPLTQSDLATMVGATRESVNRAINQLKDAHLLEINGTKLLVLDKEKLMQVVQDRGR